MRAFETSWGRALAGAVLTVLFTCGCGAKDEAAMRREEEGRLASAGRGVKPACYGALKAALRSLPRLASDIGGPIAHRPSSRAEWKAVVEQLAAADPKMKPWVSRPGIFAVASSVAASMHATGAVRATMAGEPFGTSSSERAAALTSELTSLLAEDEDVHPALFAGVLSGALTIGRTSEETRVNLERLKRPSVEHMVLGLVWVVGQQPALAHYELARVKLAELDDMERLLFHSCRLTLMFEIDAPLTMLTDLDELERGRDKLQLRPADRQQFDRLLGAGRYFALARMDRWAEAERHAAALRAQIDDPEKRLAIRLLPAAWKAKQGHYLDAVRDVRAAAAAVHDDPELVKRLGAVATELEQGLAEAKKRVLAAVLGALGGDGWMDQQAARFASLRDAMSTRVTEWSAAVPTAESLKDRATEAFGAAAERVRAAVGAAGSPAPSPGR